MTYQRILLIALAVILGNLVATWVFAGTTGTYNSQGVSGAPVSVTTAATKVLAAVAGRQFAIICNEGTVAAFCESGPTAGGAPSPAPTSVGANATPIFPSTCLTLSANQSFTPYGMGLIAQAELDCAASATDAVSTLELP